MRRTGQRPAKRAAQNALLGSARKALVLGVGGGGDVAGALATSIHCRRHGVETVLGGVSWERRPIDPMPGPRMSAEIIGAERIADSVLLAGPKTRTVSGARFAESHMAEFLGEPTLLIDPNHGPSAIAEDLIDAASQLGAEVVFYVDAGGDMLANGDETGLASPLCDAVLLAAATHAQRQGLAAVAGVFGPGCDGELTAIEVLRNLSRVWAAGGARGADTLDDEQVAQLAAATERVPTEVSVQALRCARGELGETTIRGGRRRVPLTPIGAMTFYFDPQAAVGSVARLANAVLDAVDLEDANGRLHDLGVHTELDYERELAE
jgi:hypothetical protein